MTGIRGPISGDYNMPQVPGADLRPVPRPPAELEDDELLEEWRTYWQSDVGKVAADVDIPMVSRLFLYRQEWMQIARVYMRMEDDERVVAGSRNEDALRIHPYAKQLRDLETVIQRMEDKLGISPIARARLGIEIGQASLTWQQVNQAKKAEGGALPTSKKPSLPVSSVED